MPRRSQDIVFGDLQAKVLTKVAELYWEQQDQITDEHVNALISETLSQLREEGGKDIVFNWWDRFTAPKTMEPADVVRLWIKARVRKEVAKKGKREQICRRAKQRVLRRDLNEN